MSTGHQGNVQQPAAARRRDCGAGAERPAALQRVEGAVLGFSRVACDICAACCLGNSCKRRSQAAFVLCTRNQYAGSLDIPDLSRGPPW